MSKRVSLATTACLCLAAGLYLAMAVLNRDLIDFGSFIASGRAASQGLNPYGVYDLSARVNGLGLPNLNPPISIPVFQAVAWADPHQAFLAWAVVNAALYLGTLTLLRRAYPEHATVPRLAWALSIFGFWVVLLSGQVYVLVALLAALAWLALRSERRTSAALAIGLLVALKPNFCLLPAMLYVVGRKREALLSGAVTAILSVIPALIYGPTIYVEWLQATAEISRLTETRGTLIELTSTVGMPGLGLPLTALLIVLAVARVWRRPEPVLDVMAYALVASLLLLPETNPGYLLVLLPYFFSRRWSVWTLLAAAVLVPAWPFDWYVLGSRIHVAALLLLLPEVIQTAAPAATPAPFPLAVGSLAAGSER